MACNAGKFIIENASRLQKVSNGLKFYEQDIACCRYRFSGNIYFEIRLRYDNPGFGVVLGTDNGQSLRESHTAYLCKIGFNDFSVYKTTLGNQKLMYRNANILKPDQTRPNITIYGSFENQKVTLTFKLVNKQGEIEDYSIGEYVLDERLDNYYIGIYSNAGNILQKLDIKQMVPDRWMLSLDNTRGGRAAFQRDTVLFENCRDDAELEAYKIPLPAGTYYIYYETGDVDGYNDIECFIFPSDSVIMEDEATMEDEEKSILDPTTKSFTLKQDTEVNVKFRGTSGKLSKLTLTDIKDGAFIETKDKQLRQDGSSIDVHLDGVREVRWTATIYDTIPYTDRTKPCPHAIIETKRKRYGMEDLFVRKNEKMLYTYDVKTSMLVITNTYDNRVYSRTHIPLEARDNNMIKIMYNMKATVYKLIVVEKDGSETDIVLQKTFKAYVPGTVKSPIIVTDDKKNSFDLSASYREVVHPKKKIALFRTDQEIVVPESLPNNAAEVHIYGIPRGVSVNKNAVSIVELASSYTELPFGHYQRKKNIVAVLPDVLSAYAYIAVEYTSVKDYTYLFTNYEREIFSGDTTSLVLEKALDEQNKNIILYGIPHDAYVNQEYLYRVPERAINSLDYYTDTYEIIPLDEYEVDYIGNAISLKENKGAMYQYFIVDYLKSNSYTLNYISDIASYEVDISSTDKQAFVYYDMHEDGSTNDYLLTRITPDMNKYIVLERTDAD